MTLLRAGEPIQDATQVMDLFLFGVSHDVERPSWCVLLCEPGPIARTIMFVSDAPKDGLPQLVATLQEIADRQPGAFTGVYVSHHDNGILTFPEFIELEEG